jgi:hypothetical protein
MIAGVLTSQALLIGAMDVLFVVLAFDVLALGQSGSGILTALFGVGGLIAVFVTLGLVGRRRLAPSILSAVGVTGVSIAAIAVWPSIWAAVPLIIVSNIGRSVFDVSARTLLQRTGSPAVLGRIFGLVEGVDMLGLALGSLLVPLLVALGGTTAAIVGVAAIMPLVTLAFLPAILRADASATVPIVQIGLLRATDLFRPLPPPELEGVARAMELSQMRAGEVVIREGEPGHDFYLIADGRVSVTTESGFATELGRGEGFGEIALLHDTPRTATVSAATDVSLYSLGREEFLNAVTGMADVNSAARAMAADRLEEQASA